MFEANSARRSFNILESSGLNFIERPHQERKDGAVNDFLQRVTRRERYSLFV
jgi:hypothetical protein